MNQHKGTLSTGLKWIGRLAASLPMFFIVGGVATLLWHSLAADLSSYSELSTDVFQWLGCTLLVSALSVPIGASFAVYLQFNGQHRWAQILSTLVTTASSLPGMLFGVFILLLSRTYPLGSDFLLQFLTLTLMMSCMVSHRVAEALRLAPNSMSAAALALGASRLQVIIRLLLPAVWPRAMSGILKSLGLLLGSAAPLLVLYGSHNGHNALPLKLYDQLMGGDWVSPSITQGVLTLWLMTLAIHGMSLRFNLAHEQRFKKYGSSP